MHAHQAIVDQEVSDVLHIYLKQVLQKSEMRYLTLASINLYWTEKESLVLFFQ
jgi:hypothetical protein